MKFSVVDDDAGSHRASESFYVRIKSVVVITASCGCEKKDGNGEAEWEIVRLRQQRRCERGKE